jgi:hypothetical protein
MLRKGTVGNKPSARDKVKGENSSAKKHGQDPKSASLKCNSVGNEERR